MYPRRLTGSVKDECRLAAWPSPSLASSKPILGISLAPPLALPLLPFPRVCSLATSPTTSSTPFRSSDSQCRAPPARHPLPPTSHTSSKVTSTAVPPPPSATLRSTLSSSRELCTSSAPFFFFSFLSAGSVFHVLHVVADLRICISGLFFHFFFFIGAKSIAGCSPSSASSMPLSSSTPLTWPSHA